MRSLSRSWAFSCILVAAIAVAGVVHHESGIPFSQNFFSIVFKSEEENVQATTFVFTGDVMLGRDVRNYMHVHGEDYPFNGVTHFFQNTDIVIANLEGPIVATRTPTTKKYSFAFTPRVAELLKKHHVDYVSLANNHARDDQGVKGFKETQAHLDRVGVDYFGDPVQQNKAQPIFVASTSTPVALFGFDTTIYPFILASTTALVAHVPEDTFVIVSIHWGVEYKPLHNKQQETIAHALIDAGADLIIGHHPHVVQDIEIYKDRPIFYSLGNFIFDQYWNTQVRQGLMVKLVLSANEAHYTLLPVDTTHSRNQPRFMRYQDRKAFLAELASRSTHPQVTHGFWSVMW